MTLLPGETILFTSATVVLTNRRIYNEVQGRKNYLVIFLSHLSAIKAAHISYPLLALLGVASLIAAATAFSENAFPGGAILLLILGIIFLLAFFASRRFAVLLIADSGTQISVHARASEVNALLESVQTAKLNAHE